ncbi:catalytic protein [Clohesyomyces aquaticus]|uniref:Catalytic protein n=1 Tax=Clohesyomyces aquaticus TaxID=1231657 RepID=A0A1Y2A980_9PLEO|nr:catalytic protein [Clohesyomyces aquaticus]
MTEHALDFTVIIVQGSFQIPLVYEALSTGLQARGISTFHPELPSLDVAAGSDLASKSLEDDTNAVKSLIEKLVQDEGKKVFVVMHSYGGLVGSNAIPEELSYYVRKSKGFSGGVVHLFYAAAFVLDKGLSVQGAFGENPREDIRSDGTFTLKDGAKLIYNDLPADEAALWESRMIPQSFAVKTTDITRTAYEYIPSTYLVCEKDNAVPFQAQEMLATKIGAHVERCDSGHSPMLSQTDMLVEKIIGTFKRVAV